MPLLAGLALLLSLGPPLISPATAQEPNQTRSLDSPELIPLPKPPGGTIGSGEISPGGTRFAYEVPSSDSTAQIWMLEVGTRRTRAITRGPGERLDPVWSPDGARIAYWDWGRRKADAAAGREGIWVLTLGSDRERRVFRPEAELGFAHTPRWVDRDSVLFAYYRGSLTGGSELWIIHADGTGARRVEDPSRFLRRSPTGTRRVRFAYCCNTWSHGLWVSSVDRAGERCVAGPMEYGRQAVWSPDERRMFFTIAQRDSAPTFWVSEIGRGGARQLEKPPGRLGRIGMSATGVLAAQIRTSEDTTSLWLVPEAESLSLAGDSIPACPALHPGLEAFARNEGLTGELRIREILRVPEHDFGVFRIAYDFGRGGHGYRTAVEADGHIGWIGGPCRVGPFGDSGCPVPEREEVTFRPHPDEGFPWSGPFLERLAEVGWEGRWVRLLLRAPSLPSPALDSLVARGGFDPWLVEDARVKDRPDLLLRIRERHARFAGVGEAVFEALWRHALELVRDPGTSRDVLLDLARSVPRRAASESLAVAVGRALLARPGSGRDPEVLVRLANVPPSADSALFRTAGRRLLEDPSASPSALRGAAANLAADPGLAERLFRDPRVLGDPRALLALARTPWRDWSVAERPEGC